MRIMVQRYKKAACDARRSESQRCIAPIRSKQFTKMPDEEPVEPGTSLSGKSPDETSYNTYFCTYEYLYHQVCSGDK